MSARQHSALCAAFAVCLVAASQLSAQSPAAQEHPQRLVVASCDSASGEVAEVCRINARWDEANLKMDPSLVEPILDEQFFWVAGERLRPKEDIVEILRSTAVRFDTYESANVVVYLGHNMAHAVGISKRSVRVGPPEHTGEWRFTRTFVKRGGEWHILSHHYTRLDWR